MFVKYSSLENHTQEKFINSVKYQNDLEPKQFVAREKIHGTNFSVIITDSSIIPCKRTCPIHDYEDFFDYRRIMKKYNPAFEQIQEFVRDSETLRHIQVFGEYAGDGIQKEISYGEQDFYLFDVLFVGVEEGSEGYLSEFDLQAFAINYGFKVPPLVHIGTLDECLSLPVEFESLVNSITEENKYGFFKQEPSKGNTAEGLVIKPETPTYLRTGQRVAIKYKTDKFKERSKPKAPKVDKSLSEGDLKVLNILLEYNTLARISNVISHIGEVTNKDFARIVGLTVKDIITEAAREYEFEVDNEKLIKSRLNQGVAELLRQNIQKFF